jgi:hypothetical protein
MRTEWDRYRREYDKGYTQDVIESRYNIFALNYLEILRVNSDSSRGYTMALNEFADYTDGDFSNALGYNNRPTNQRRLSILNGNNFRGKQTENEVGENQFEDVEIGEEQARQLQSTEVDWVEMGAVGPVKDQHPFVSPRCASSYAFAAAGFIEGQWKIKNGTLLDISVQSLMDCSRNSGRNHGCNGGGIPADVVEYARTKIPSLCLENRENMYLNYDHICRVCRGSHESAVVSLSPYTEVGVHSNSFLERVVRKGPVVAAIRADSKAFKFYSGGIIGNGDCQAKLAPVNHAVLVVGFGTDNGVPYWKIKNSWGTTWGEQGYARISRDTRWTGTAGECGILSSYTLLL